MSIQISTSLDNLALGCSTTQADLTWALQRNPLPSGAQPRFVRIDNINNSTGVFVSITPTTETITVAGSSTTGNCFFIAPNSYYPAFVKNTRIYSTLLISNNCKHRWRGRYNEDTDICLRVLKDGDCTIQFNEIGRAHV